MDSKSLVVKGEISPLHLRPINDGQKALLRLISEKYQNGGIISKDEMTKIWNEKIRRHNKFWDYYGGEYDTTLKRRTGAYRDYEDFQIDQLVTSWVLRALGALIQKGYLTVIPRMQFSSLQEANNGR